MMRNAIVIVTTERSIRYFRFVRPESGGDEFHDRLQKMARTFCAVVNTADSPDPEVNVDPDEVYERVLNALRGISYKAFHEGFMLDYLPCDYFTDIA